MSQKSTSLCPLYKVLQAITLSCVFSSAAQAQETLSFLQLDTTDTVHTKHYQLGGYRIVDDSVEMNLSNWRAFQIATELIDSSYTYVSFSSKELGTPDKENCIFIPFNEEVLNIKKGFWRTQIQVENVNLSLQDNIEDRNCIALTKQKLGSAIKAALS